MQGNVINNDHSNGVIERVSLKAPISFSDACLEREGNMAVAAEIAKIPKGS